MLKRIDDVIWDTETREQAALFINDEWCTMRRNRKARGYETTSATATDAAKYNALPKHKGVHPLDALTPSKCERCSGAVVCQRCGMRVS